MFDVIKAIVSQAIGQVSDCDSSQLNATKPGQVQAFDTPRIHGMLSTGVMWPQNSTIKVYMQQPTDGQSQLVIEALDQWIRLTNLTIEHSSRADSDVRIGFKNDGNWSMLGTRALTAPNDQLTMNLQSSNRAGDLYIAMHEVGHMLGLIHEHQSPDADIQWDRDAVFQDMSKPPNSWTWEQVNRNIFNKVALHTVQGTKFDPDSIMLYSYPKHWTKNGKGQEMNTELSNKDILLISGEKGYPKGFTPKKSQGNVIQSLESISITEGMKYAVIDFTLTEPMECHIQTYGENDVVMDLTHGSEQIATDDDSGRGFNAKIIQNLQAGHYSIHVRPYQRNMQTFEFKLSIIGI